MKRKTNYFFRLSNSLLILEERKCEINDEECMYLLFYLLLVCEHQITICFFLFVCLFVCLPSHSSHYGSYNACHYELLSFRSGTPLRPQRSEVRSLMETQNFS